jgi:hypothetical protein
MFGGAKEELSAFFLMVGGVGKLRRFGNAKRSWRRIGLFSQKNQLTPV